MTGNKDRKEREDTTAQLEKLWKELKAQPPGKIVGINSKVASSNGSKER